MAEKLQLSEYTRRVLSYASMLDFGEEVVPRKLASDSREKREKFLDLEREDSHLRVYLNSGDLPFPEGLDPRKVSDEDLTLTNKALVAYHTNRLEDLAQNSDVFPILEREIYASLPDELKDTMYGDVLASPVFLGSAAEGLSDGLKKAQKRWLNRRALLKAVRDENENSITKTLRELYAIEENEEPELIKVFAKLTGEYTEGEALKAGTLMLARAEAARALPYLQKEGKIKVYDQAKETTEGRFSIYRALSSSYSTMQAIAQQQAENQDQEEPIAA